MEKAIHIGMALTLAFKNPLVTQTGRSASLSNNLVVDKKNLVLGKSNHLAGTS